MPHLLTLDQSKTYSGDFQLRFFYKEAVFFHLCLFGAALNAFRGSEEEIASLYRSERHESNIDSYYDMKVLTLCLNYFPASIP